MESSSVIIERRPHTLSRKNKPKIIERDTILELFCVRCGDVMKKTESNGRQVFVCRPCKITITGKMKSVKVSTDADELANIQEGRWRK